MAFVNQSVSVYQIRPQHRNEEVRELLPADFAGVMICDRGRSCDAKELARVAQQKCLSHLIRNVKAVAEGKTGRARHFSRHLKELLQQALALSAAYEEMDGEDYWKQADELHEELTFHLRQRVLRDPDNQRLLTGIGEQHAEGRVLRFLGEEGVAETNNQAKRDLRPAVIARKISQCSKNQRGARVFEAFERVANSLQDQSAGTCGVCREADQPSRSGLRPATTPPR